MGLTQHRNGVAVIQEVVNLLLMNGHIGRRGAGLCPVAAIPTYKAIAVGIWEAPTTAFWTVWKRVSDSNCPRHHENDVVHAIQAMLDESVDVFVCMGGNFLSATPDTDLTARALNNVGLTVQISTKLNRSHLVTGKNAPILPCLGRTEVDVQQSGEQFVTVENSMGVVHRSTGGLTPASPDLRSEPSIVASIAEATLSSTDIDWSGLADDYDRIRDLMAFVGWI